MAALLVTVPVPTEAEVSSETLEKVLSESFGDAERSNVTGKNVTPFLLARMSERSHGATLRANIALLENNARAATKIACALNATL